MEHALELKVATEKNAWNVKNKQRIVHTTSL